KRRCVVAPGEASVLFMVSASGSHWSSVAVESRNLRLGLPVAIDGASREILGVAGWFDLWRHHRPPTSERYPPDSTARIGAGVRRTTTGPTEAVGGGRGDERALLCS